MVPKGAKLPLKFYVKAAGNVSSVKTEKARRVQQQYFGMHNGCVFAQSQYSIRSKKMGLSGPCRPTIVASGPIQVAGLSMGDEGLMSRRE
jgi:hypothetical protein